MTAAPLVPGPVTVRVPAKVNLELLVGPRRDDGYHGLSTVFHAVSLYDDVTVSVADEWGVSVSGPLAAGVPEDGNNLAMRAARLVEGRFDVEPVHISIRKGIPVSGGMAGGSADAAATLVALDHLWALDLDREEIEELGAELGSDVPFLVAGGTAMGSGRGEMLAPVLARGTYHWVFALAEGGLSTPAVYAECDRLRGGDDVPEPVATPALMSALRSGDARELAPQLTNDLQDAAISLRPDLGEVLSAGMEYGALAASCPAPGRPRPSSSTTTRPASTSPWRSPRAAWCATCGGPAARSTAPTSSTTRSTSGQPRLRRARLPRARHRPGARCRVARRRRRRPDRHRRPERRRQDHPAARARGLARGGLRPGGSGGWPHHRRAHPGRRHGPRGHGARDGHRRPAGARLGGDRKSV